MPEAVNPVVAGLRAMTFLLAVFTALIAAQLYNLIKAGELARSWRPFIISALVFAVWALAWFANTFFGFIFDSRSNLAFVMDLLQTLFILLFAMGFWQQRQAFFNPKQFRPSDEDGVETLDSPDPQDPRELARSEE
jgi:hypothetical protein